MNKLYLLMALFATACTVQTVPARRSSPPPYESRPSPPPPQPDAPPDRPPPGPRHEWDSRGWQLLGEKTVDGKNDADQIDFSQKMGTVSRLTITVVDSDLEMQDLRIVYVSGNDYRPTGRHYFREGSRTRVIELSKAEILRAVQFKYSNLPGGGRARVQVWMQ